MPTGRRHGDNAFQLALFQQEMPEIFVGLGAFEEDAVGHNHVAPAIDGEKLHHPFHKAPRLDQADGLLAL